MPQPSPRATAAREPPARTVAGLLCRSRRAATRMARRARFSNVRRDSPLRAQEDERPGRLPGPFRLTLLYLPLPVVAPPDGGWLGCVAAWLGCGPALGGALGAVFCLGAFLHP